MNAEELVRHLGLPNEAIVNRRVPKSVFSEHAGVTPKDRRLIKEDIDSLWWVAVLKPETIGVRAQSNHEKDYSELSVLNLKVREDKRCRQVSELIHRAIPYHTLLLAEAPSMLSVSVAEMRRSRSETDRYILEDGLIWTDLKTAMADGFEEEFAVSMSIESVSPKDLRDLYLSWQDSIVSLEIAGVTGGFQVSPNPIRAIIRASALRDYQSGQREVEFIRRKAKRETQAARRVELNIALQELKQRQEVAVRTLYSPETLTS